MYSYFKTLRSFPRVRKGQKVSAALVNAWADAIEELLNQTRYGAAADDAAAAAGDARPFDVYASVADGVLKWRCPRGIVYGDGRDTTVITDLGERAGTVELDEETGQKTTYYACLSFPMRTVIPMLGDDAAVSADSFTYKRATLGAAAEEGYVTPYGEEEDAVMEGGEYVVQMINCALTSEVHSEKGWKPEIIVKKDFELSLWQSYFREMFPIDSSASGYDGYYHGLWLFPIAVITVSADGSACSVANILRSDFFLFGQAYEPN